MARVAGKLRLPLFYTLNSGKIVSFPVRSLLRNPFDNARNRMLFTPDCEVCIIADAVTDNGLVIFDTYDFSVSGVSYFNRSMASLVSGVRTAVIRSAIFSK